MKRRPDRAARAVVAWDSWAFIESAIGGRRASEVADLLAGCDGVVTSRDVVAETFNFLVRDTGRTAIAWKWLEAVASSRIRIHDPPLDEVLEFVGRDARRGNLSFTDYSLACVASVAGAVAVASEDREFRRVGLDPLFAR